MLGARISESPFMAARVSIPTYPAASSPSGFDASPSLTAILTTPMALPATTITAMDGLITPILNHGPLAPHPSPLAAPSSIEPKVSEPPPSSSKVSSPRPTTASTATAVIGLGDSVCH
ncbi:UNVERIFIED_CONTAM: hypothetical protein Sradi_0010400 [Sesamum radiatum]|uniref:Uncharacterized protein n=1 Tax=Sesamum radiatum TaxID=300843 RepID=A0AAW2WKE3_SESRA